MSLSLEEKRERRRAYYLKNRDKILEQRRAKRLAKKEGGVSLGELYGSGDIDFADVNEMRA
jgi:hypothetical protein